MIIKKTYTFRDYAIWDDELHAAGLDFKEKFQIYPNILIASDTTYNRINLVANQKRDRLKDENGASWSDESGFVDLSTFVDEEWEVDFMQDNGLADDVIVLIYDSDPDDGGEDIPDEDTEPTGQPEAKKKQVKVAA